MNNEKRFCINCGTAYDLGTNFCSKCGSDLTQQGSTNQGNSQQYVQSVQAEQNNQQMPANQGSNQQYVQPVQSVQNNQQYVQQPPAPKKKKNTAVIVAIIVVILAVLAFIGERAERIYQQEGAEYEDFFKPESSVSSKKEDDSKNNVKIAHLVANTKGEFIEGIKKYVDIDEYTITYEKEDAVFYSLKDENRIKYDFDYEVKLDDGTNIKLPVTNDVLKKNGWTSEKDENENAEDFLGNNYTNKDGQTIRMLSSSKKPIKDCEYNGISFIVSEYSIGIKDFSMLGGITKDSSIGDVIAKLGKPTAMNYSCSEFGASVSIVYDASPADVDSNLYFTIDTETDGKGIKDIIYIMPK